MAVDSDVKEDEALDAVVEVDVLEDSRKPIFHVFADADLLLIERLDLHELVLVVKGQQEGIVNEVEVG